MNSPLAERMRPSDLVSYVGQEHLVGKKGVLNKQIESGLLPSLIFWGPPGTGKTTLANIIAKQSQRSFFTLSAITSGIKEVREVIEQSKKNMGLFTPKNPILFIDEIHRLSPIVEEYLYSAMEDYKIDIMIESGPNARTVQINLNPFTLIGATTRSGLLTAPMRARFGIQSRLQYYSTELLADIVQRSASILKVPISMEAAIELASRSRGTPRIANALLRRIRDFAQIKGNGLGPLPFICV